MSIEDEIWWKREIVPANLDRLVDKLCAFFQIPRINGGTKGNAAHRNGRHRSREWVLNSQYCSDSARDYGTHDPRDRRGDPRWIRAFDLTLPRRQLIAVCTRVDAAVLAGELPTLAEWFGTVDGEHVTGWFEGHRSSADSSHLEHMHGGFWTGNADDDHTHLFEIMTGEPMPTAQENADAVWAKKAREYVDQDHDGTLDTRTTLDVLFATHAAAVAAADPRRVAEMVVEGLIAQGLPPAAPVDDVQIERVFRKVLGSLDAPGT